MSNQFGFGQQNNTAAPEKTPEQIEAEELAELEELEREEAAEKAEAERKAAKAKKEPALEELEAEPAKEKSAAKAAPVRKPRGTAAVGASKDKGAAKLVRAAATKTLDVEAADANDRRMAAAILGCEDDTVDLATAIQTTLKNPLRALDDGESVEQVEGAVDRVVEAGSLERERLRNVWQMLNLLDKVPAEMPAADIKAAAEAAGKIDDFESLTSTLRELLTKN